jgi:hypothetical protein
MNTAFGFYVSSEVTVCVSFLTFALPVLSVEIAPVQCGRYHPNRKR